MLRRIDDIELLRAIAILGVAIEHAERNLITWHSPWFTWVLSHVRGWSGVDLFFAVSGFVIARDLLPRLQSCTHPGSFLKTTLAFWIRRAFRLLPSAWLWLALILIAVIFFNRSGVFRSYESAWGGTVASVLQYANIRFAHCFARYECGANYYFWSLSLENQFYLLLPLFFFLTRHWMVYLMGGLILVQLLMPWRPLLLINLRMDGLLLGVLIAIWARTLSYRHVEPRWLARSPLARWGVLLGLLFMLGYTTAAQDTWKLANFRFSLIAILSALLVWIASYDRDYLLAAPVLKKPMLWIGSRSYAIYLIHPFVYAAILEAAYRLSSKKGQVYALFDASYTAPFVGAAILGILVLSELTYRCVEEPCRRVGAGISARMLEKIRV